MDRLVEYLAGRGYAAHVVGNGLEGLLRGWEETVASVASGEEQFQDDYLNDVDGRRILEEALPYVEGEELSAALDRIRAADARIRPHLVPTAECLWGEPNALKYGYSRDRDWWYYHRPEKVDQSWRAF